MQDDPRIKALAASLRETLKKRVGEEGVTPEFIEKMKGVVEQVVLPLTEDHFKVDAAVDPTTPDALVVTLIPKDEIGEALLRVLRERKNEA
jgi:hypothetical protein